MKFKFYGGVDAPDWLLVRAVPRQASNPTPTTTPPARLDRPHRGVRPFRVSAPARTLTPHHGSPRPHPG